MPIPQSESALRALAEEHLRTSDAHGAAVAVLRNGEPAARAGVGFSDLEGTRRLDSEAPVLIYSVTKTLLAAAVMRLVEQGSVDLDGSLGALHHGMDFDTAITLRQVLNHTAGLPDYGPLPEYHESVRSTPASPWTDETFLERTLSQGMLFAPGEGWAYSNIGYMLVRRIVAAEAGGSLPAALADLLFRPLGLRQTRVAETLDDTRDLAPGFTTAIGDGKLADIRGRYHPGWVSHGVVRSTAAEIATLLDAIVSGVVVSATSLAAMREAVVVPAEHPVIRQPGYGLGLMIDRDPDSGELAGHAGGGPGYATAAFTLRGADGRRVTSVAFVNRDGGETGGETATEIAVALARAVAMDG